MITSSKTLSSGHAVYLRTDIAANHDCSTVYCETANTLTHDDKEEVRTLAEEIVGKTKHKGEFKVHYDAPRTRDQVKKLLEGAK